jgi:hypothetical protein
LDGRHGAGRSLAAEPLPEASVDERDRVLRLLALRSGYRVNDLPIAIGFAPTTEHSARLIRGKISCSLKIFPAFAKQSAGRRLCELGIRYFRWRLHFRKRDNVASGRRPRLAVPFRERKIVIIYYFFSLRRFRIGWRVRLRVRLRFISRVRLRVDWIVSRYGDFLKSIVIPDRYYRSVARWLSVNQRVRPRFVLSVILRGCLCVVCASARKAI